MTDAPLYLGAPLDAPDTPWHLDADKLRTHGVIVGMTGSGKTGLSLVLLEELVRAGVPIVAIDPKGDLGSLGLLFAGLAPEHFAPWVEGADPAEVAERWRTGLAKWRLDDSHVDHLASRLDLRLYTPGSSAGRSVDVLGAFRRPPAHILADTEARRQLVSTTVSGLLGLTGREADPVRDPAHVVMSRILDDAWSAGQDPDLEALILALVDPPFERVGVFAVDRFFPSKARMDLAMDLNAVLASPAFQAWRHGDPLDLDRLLAAPASESAPVPVSIITLSHLPEAQRRFFLSILLGRLQAWSRRQPGTEGLRAALVFDEVAGYLPPHPKNPATKGPLLTLMKQARAVGLGVVLCTQNPVDLDYKALSNAGTWMVGRLQTKQDRDRLLAGIGRRDLDSAVEGLGKREFLVHVAGREPSLIASRHAMCFLRGPLTPVEIRKLAGAAPPAQSPKTPSVKSSSAPPPLPPPLPSAPPPLPGAPLASTPPPLPPAASVPPPLPSTPLPTAPPAAPSPDDGLLSAPPPTPGTPLWLDPAVAHSARLRDVFGLASSPRRTDGATEWAPALHLDVRLRFDDHRSGFDKEEHHHRVWFPIDPHRPLQDAPQPARLEDRDLLVEPPAGPGRYHPLPSTVDEERERKALERRVRDDIYRSESRGQFIHKRLKLHGHTEESEGEFTARCRAAAEEEASDRIEKLRDKAERAADRLDDKLARTRQRIVEQEGVVQGRKAEEVVGIGETVLSLFVGRRRSLSTAVSRRARTTRSSQHLEGLRDQLARLEEEAADLTLKLEDDIAQIRDEWAAIAEDGVEERQISIDKSDIDIVRMGILWVPVSRSV